MKFDANAIQAAIVAKLPNRARWLIDDTPLDFDFSPTRGGLRRVESQDFNSVTTLDSEWRDLFVFGTSDYSEGGGAAALLGVRESDGAVYGLDVERTKPMFLVNSSISQFIDTFTALDPYLRNGETPPAAIRMRVQAIDSPAFPHSEWRLLIDHVVGEEI